MTQKRYLVEPGWVTSQHDGQRHWISYEQLVRLYGVDPAECTQAWRGERRLVELRPRHDGNYAVPA